MATHPFVPALAARILLKGVDQGRIFSVGFYSVKTVPATPTESELAALAAAVATAMTGNAFLGNVSPSVTFSEVEARDASVERGPSASETIDAVGSAADGIGSAMAAKVVIEPAAGVFQFRPSQAFLPGVPFSALTEPGSDTLTSAYITASQTFVESLATAMATVSTYQLGCVSKFFHAVARPTALVSQAGSFATRPRVATQVRRLRRVSRA